MPTVSYKLSQIFLNIYFKWNAPISKFACHEIFGMFFKLTKCRETLLFALFLATDKNNRKINMINIDKEINGSHLQDNSGTIMTSWNIFCQQ